MANPTTNYSWPMPTSTDLVTDLPADFALFGQPVDTTLKALNPQTTTGALAYRSAVSNVNTALPIGSTSQILTVVGGVPAWATAATAASGMTLITRQTFSAVTTTTTTFDGCFTSTYESYLVVAEKFFGSDANADIQFQLRYAGPATQATGYYGSTTEFGSAATFTDQSNANQFAMMLYTGTTNQPSPFNFFITMVGNGSRNPGWNGGAMNGGINRPYFFGGSQLGAAREYTGLLFLAAAGTISGTIAVYGLAKA